MRRFYYFSIGLFALLCLPASARANETAAFHETLRQEADAAMRLYMKEEDIVGATISIVHQGEVILANGYGYKNLESKEPVDPTTTLFRVASISKIFTWLGVMQQVERGNLDLDADVNTYLKQVEIPATFDEPVTLRHILAHNAGFEDRVIALWARDASAMVPLTQLFGDQFPKRVRPPGEFSSYSNQATMLAGHIVANVSGMSWEEYVEQEILTPLGMQYITPRQPIPAELAAFMSEGYKRKGPDFEAGGFEFVAEAPAGGISASAQAISKLMLALLNDGELNGQRILKAETSQLMKSRLFAHDPRVNGMAHGLIETRYNGERYVGHDGATFLFHSSCLMNDVQDFGIFISCNTYHGGAFPGKVAMGIADLLTDPAPVEAVKPGADAYAAVRRVTGLYISMRRDHTRMAKIGVLVGSLVNVTADDDGSITAPSSYDGKPRRWAEIEPYVFREAEGPEVLVFRAGEDGRATHMFRENSPAAAYERMMWYGQPGLIALLFGVMAFLFIPTLVVWPVGGFLRRISEGKAPGSGMPTLMRFVAWWICALQVYFVVQLGLILRDPDEVAYGVPADLAQLLSLNMGVAAAALLLVPFTYLAFARRYWSLANRVHYAAVTVTVFTFIWWQYAWNLLGHHY